MQRKEPTRPMTPASRLENLPTDVAQCHSLIEELSASLREHQRRAAQLEQRVEQLLKRLYGPRAERIDPAQLTLFAEAMVAAQESEGAAEEQAPRPASRKGHGRKPLPKDLTRKLACWAHCRRYFYDARSTDPDRAHRVLAWIRQLYHIEREGKELDAQARRTLRQEESKPLFEGDENSKGLQKWLTEQQAAVLPKSPIGEAITYAMNNWTALTRYLEDGILDIDNNEAEQALRGIAVGRKNWLFLGSDRGGRAAANHYSLIQSAKRHGLDPFAYLRDVLLRITTEPATDLRELLPDRWKAALES